MAKRLDCLHTDTCLADYWGGHHSPHLQIPVRNGMTFKEVRQALHDELRQGFVAGSDPIVNDDSGIEGDKWYKKAHAAIDRDVKPKVKYTKIAFRDIDMSDNDDDAPTIYAFFVFRASE